MEFGTVSDVQVPLLLAGEGIRNSESRGRDDLPYIVSDEEWDPTHCKSDAVLAHDCSNNTSHLLVLTSNRDMTYIINRREWVGPGFAPWAVSEMVEFEQPTTR